MDYKSYREGFMNPGWLKKKLMKWSGYTFHKGLYKKFAKRLGLRGDESVLDFGAGVGALSLHLAKRLRQGGKLIVSDISEPFIDIARRKLRRFDNVEFQLGDASDLDIADRTLDIIVIHNMLHDISPVERPGIINTLADKLRDSGVLFIREPVETAHGMLPREIRELMSASGLKEWIGEEDHFRRTAFFGKFVKE